MLALNMESVFMLIIEFFLFSVGGWCMEVILKYRQFHKFINRGFLIGPYCPIYGSGAVLVTVIVGGIAGQNASIGDTFLIGFIACGFLEYFVSWFMETMFHARWWDYSQKPMNLNGRIWIGNLILFGVGSLIIVKVIDPVLFDWLLGWPKYAVVITACIIAVVMSVDAILSRILMGIVKNEIDNRDEDNTEEVSSKVRELLANRSVLTKRIMEAYPNLQARPKQLMDQFKAVKKEFKQAKKMYTAAIDTAVRSGSDAARLKVEEAKNLQREAAIKFKTMQDKLRIRREI